MASLSYSKKAKGPCWTFISDEDNNVFVFRYGKKMEVNGYTFPRVISLELVTEEQLQETSLEIPVSDAIYIMFADQKQVILKVSNFRSTKGEFTEEFKNAKTSIAFLKVFLDLTTTNSELIPDANDLDDTGISTCMMTEDSEVIPDTQHCAKTPQSTRKIHIPPIMSLPVSANTSVDVHENEQSMNEICNKVFEGTYRVKLSQISDAPDEIRFQDVDEMFVKEMKNDIKEFSSPQPLALLLVNQSNLDVHSGNLTNVNDEKYVCIGGNHLRSAYQLCGREFADAKIYTGLTDEECLIVSRVYNDMGHFIKKMTNLDLILLLRRQLNPKTSERTTDVNIIKEWRSRISQILPKERNIKSIQPLINIAMGRASIYDKVVRIYKLFAEHKLKDQKQRKSSAVIESGLKSTGAWKSMMTLDEDIIEILLDNVIQKRMTLEELQKKFEEIKGYRMLQKKIIQSKELKWTEVVGKFYNGNDEEAENTLHPYLGMSQSSEFDNYIKNMTDCHDCDENTLSDKQYKFLAVKELRAADFIFLAEEEVKEETIRKIHAKNIERSIPKYTIASFTQLNKETEKVADYCYGKIAINVQQKKGSESHFTDLQEMHVAQFGSKTVTTLPGKTAKQYFCLKNLNDLSEIFNLFCHVNSMVLIINSKLINIIQSFQVIKCVIYVHFINSVDKKNLKRKFHAIEEE